MGYSSFDDVQTARPKWEPHYTWVPKKVNDKWYWMTTIYRKVKVVYGDRKLEPVEYTYGDEFDLLKEQHDR